MLLVVLSYSSSGCCQVGGITPAGGNFVGLGLDVLFLFRPLGGISEDDAREGEQMLVSAFSRHAHGLAVRLQLDFKLF